MKENYFYSLQKQEGKGFTHVCLFACLCICLCFCVSVRSMAAVSIPLDGGQASFTFKLPRFNALYYHVYHIFRCVCYDPPRGVCGEP